MKFIFNITNKFSIDYYYKMIRDKLRWGFEYDWKRLLDFDRTNTAAKKNLRIFFFILLLVYFIFYFLFAQKNRTAGDEKLWFEIVLHVVE